jgi:FKBP-type peptidyl-prolyl cis-trans isomerase FklB
LRAHQTFLRKPIPFILRATPETQLRFAEISPGCDNVYMPKFFTIPVTILAVIMLLPGNTFAQQTPAATTQSGSATAASGKTQTPGAKRPATAAKTTAPLALKTSKDKFSYALGMKMGTNLKRQDVPVDPNILARGLKDGLAGSKTLLTDDEAQAAIVQVQTELRTKQQEKMQEAGAANKKEGDTFLTGNKAKEGVVTLPSGLQYKILKEGTGPKPAATDSVVCNYRGTLINGTEFDSSYKRGQPATFPVNGVIKGWTEALQLMPVGSKWQLFIPAELAYGERGPDPAIGPNATLIFEVELLSIEDKSSKEKAPENPEKAPDSKPNMPDDKPKSPDNPQK